MSGGTQNKGVFHVFHSNNLDDLAELTAKLLELNCPKNPFDPVSFIVPNAGMKNWLDIHLAESMKISMQNSYDFPWSFVWKLFSHLGLVEESRPQERYRLDTMIWTIYTVLGDILNSDEPNLKAAFSSIYHYVRSSDSAGSKIDDLTADVFSWDSSPEIISLSGDKDETKLYQLSQAIAEIFDRYIIYRSDWLQKSSNSDIDYVADFHLYTPGEASDQQCLQLNSRQARDAMDYLWGGITPEKFADLNHRQQILIRNNIWQVILWRRVILHNSEVGSVKLKTGDEVKEGHIANMIDIFTKRIVKEESMRKKLPPAVFVFGISALEPLFYRLLKAMSEYVKIFYLNFNPCRHYWGDVRHSRTGSGGVTESLYEKIRSLNRTMWNKEEKAFCSGNGHPVSFTGSTITENDSGDEIIDENNYAGNRLLASWGRQGSDNLYMLVDNMTADSEVFEDPLDSEKKAGVLQLLQSLVLNDTEISPFKYAFNPEEKNKQQRDNTNFIFEDLEHNLEVHICYSRLREIEAVYDKILRLFDSDNTLKPNDLVVMAPNITAYAPFIDGVFGKKQFEYERNIPYVISDQTYDELSTFLNSIFDLLNLPWSRINGSLVIKLLDVEQICSRFGFDGKDSALIESWIMNASIRGDYCEEDLYEEQNLDDRVPVYSTWRRAIPRIVAGSVMPEGTSCWLGRIQLYSEVRGQNIETFASLCQFVEALADLRKRLSDLTGGSGLTAREWLEFINERVLEIFYEETEEVSGDIIALNEMITELKDKFDNINEDKKISLDVFISYLKGAAGKKGSFKPFMSGMVNFCTFVPMRSIPFRYIFMIGMNNNDFPRKDLAYDFDLMRRNNGQFARPGDRSSRNDDRYMFLETLMSASDGIYISYIGRSIVNNSELNPSVVVTELLGFLADNLAVRDIYEKFLNEKKSIDSCCCDDILKIGPKLNRLVKENSSALTDPHFNRLVFEDRIHLWDSDNFISGSARQSFQGEWCPYSEGGNALGFYVSYLGQCIDLMNINVSETFLCADQTRAKNVINHILEQVYHSCFNFADVINSSRKISLPSVSAADVMENKDFRYGRGYEAMCDDLHNIQGDDRRARLEKRRVVTDHMPLVILDTLISFADRSAQCRCVISTDVYSVGNHVETLLTDAGIFYKGFYSDENGKIRNNISAGHRTLTLKIRDLTEFMDNPLDAMYRKRFNVSRDENEKFVRVIDDVEPMDVLKLDDISLKQKISEFCLRFIEERKDIDWQSGDVDSLYSRLMKPGNGDDNLSFHDFFEELKYGGYLPNGHSAVYKNHAEEKHYDAADLLKIDCSGNFKTGIMRNKVLDSNGFISSRNGKRILNRAEAVHIHYEIRLCGDDIPIPYRSVFRNMESPFTVVIDDIIDDMYQDDEGKRFYVLINDIHNIDRQKRKFFLNILLLSLMNAKGSGAESRLEGAKFFMIKNGSVNGKESINVQFGDRQREYCSFAEFYLKELTVCYLRGMNEPLAVIEDSSLKDAEMFELPEDIPDHCVPGVMAGITPFVREEFFCKDSFSDELRYIFSKDSGETYVSEKETVQHCEKLSRIFKNIKFSESDYLNTSQDYSGAVKFSIRNRSLFQNVEDIPIRKSLALKFILSDLPKLIMGRVKG